MTDVGIPSIVGDCGLSERDKVIAERLPVKPLLELGLDEGRPHAELCCVRAALKEKAVLLIGATSLFQGWRTAARQSWFEISPRSV